MRVGVVGCGIIAARYVGDAPAFAHWRPVACSDLDSAACDAFGATHGLCSLSFDELLADDEIDLVLNLTPPRAHYEIVSRALAAGKHVYTEKPLASCVAEARELVAQASVGGLHLDRSARRFAVHGESLVLPAREFEVLQELMTPPGRGVEGCVEGCSGAPSPSSHSWRQCSSCRGSPVPTRPSRYRRCRPRRAAPRAGRPAGARPAPPG